MPISDKETKTLSTPVSDVPTASIGHGYLPAPSSPPNTTY